jgi:hypothetical protein
MQGMPPSARASINRVSLTAVHINKVHTFRANKKSCSAVMTSFSFVATIQIYAPDANDYQCGIGSCLTLT